ncbi:MAG: hypothetical protein IJH63_00825 [Methanobrevibacter sp.]|nr:hypothetical protein [Methanobrevibacter sp.]
MGGNMTENKRFTMDNPNDWGFPITDNVTGKVYNCASNILMKELCVVVNTIVEENEKLKRGLEVSKQSHDDTYKELEQYIREFGRIKVKH